MSTHADIELGATYRDSATGFTGIAVAHTIYIAGHARTKIAPTNHVHRTCKPRWIDDLFLTRVPAKIEEAA